MATPPTFTAGAVLTAAQMNSVGLWLVKTQTIGSAVSSVNVTSAFSSDYDSYLIQMNTVVSANQPNMGLRLGTTVTNYVYSGLYLGTASATITGDVTTVATYWNIGACGNGTTGSGRISFDVNVDSPNLAQQTFYGAQNMSLAWSNMYGGYLTNTTQYTDFTLLPSSGTMTGGTICVYGYRKA